MKSLSKKNTATLQRTPTVRKGAGIYSRFKYLFVFCLGVGIFCGLAGCGHQPEPSPVGAPTLTWNWLDFSRSDRLTLASLQAVIEPAQVEEIKAPREGWLILSEKLSGIQDKEEMLEANTIIGQMAPGIEKLEQESEALHQELAKIEDALRVLHNDEAKETFADQERKAKEDIARYKAALELQKDPALQRDLIPGSEQASQDEIKRIEDRLESSKKRLQEVQIATEAQAKLQKRQIDLTDAKAAFERAQKQERDTLRAPFAGQMRWLIHFEAPKEQAPHLASPTTSADTTDAANTTLPKETPPPARRVWVRADTVVGVLHDNAALWAKIELSDASILSVPVEQLFFSFKAGGEPVEAPFGGTAGSQRSVPLYKFGIKEATPACLRLVGGIVAGDLTEHLPQMAYVVPKIRLQVYRPDAFVDGDWIKNCARVFPGAQVLAVGRDQIALVPSDTANEKEKDATVEAKP